MVKLFIFFLFPFFPVSVWCGDALAAMSSTEMTYLPDSIPWKVFKSYEGRFRLVVPGEMIEKIDSIETRIGVLAYHTYFFQPEDEHADNLLYMLSYCDYPEYSVHSDSTDLLDDFFDTTIETAVESVNGELLYSDVIQFKHYPGRIWRIDYLDGKAVIKTKVFLIGRRYYSLQTIMHIGRSLNLSSDKFLDSFRLL